MSTFLHIEDDADYHSRLHLLFEEKGHELVGLPYAERAVALFDQEKMAGAIFDIYMDKVSGLEALRAMLQRIPKLRFVVVSNYTGVIDQEARDLTISSEQIYRKSGEPRDAVQILAKFRRQGLALDEEGKDVAAEPSAR